MIYLLNMLSNQKSISINSRMGRLDITINASIQVKVSFAFSIPNFPRFSCLLYHKTPCKSSVFNGFGRFPCSFPYYWMSLYIFISSDQKEMR